MDLDLVEKYNKLKDLFDSGFIVEYEFNNRKRELLGDQYDSFEKNLKLTSNQTDNNSSSSNTTDSYSYNYNSNYNSDYSSNSYSYNNTTNNNDDDIYANNIPTIGYNSGNSSIPTYDYNQNNYNTVTEVTSSSYDYSGYNIEPYNGINAVNMNNINTSNNNHSIMDFFGGDDTDKVNNSTYDYSSNYSTPTPVSYTYDYNNTTQEDETKVASVASSSPTIVEPVSKPAPVSKIVKDKLTSNSKAKEEITYPLQVRGSYLIFDKPIEGVIAYYRTKEFLYQSELTPLDKMDELDNVIRSKFFSNYALQEILVKPRVAKDNEFFTYESSYEEGNIFNIHDTKLKPGHYRIVPVGFKMIRGSACPTILGSFQNEYVKDYAMAPQHFITHTPSYTNTYSNNYITYRDAINLNNVKMSTHFDTKSNFNKRLWFLHKIRLTQFKGQNKERMENIILPREDVNLSKSIDQCLEQKKCLICQSSAYSEFLCYEHYDDSLVSLYNEVKNDFKKDIVTVTEEEKRQQKVYENFENQSKEVRDYSKEPKFCYVDPNAIVNKRSNTFTELIQKKFACHLDD